MHALYLSGIINAVIDYLQVETVCVHKSPRTLRFKSEDFRLMRKCNIFKPASLALINGTVYVGDTSVLSMKFHSKFEILGTLFSNKRE